MKKRAMKKWIPRATHFCGHCKWRIIGNRIDSDTQLKESYCLYLQKGDIDLPYGALWMGYKACGEHETDEQLERKVYKESKQLYRHRNKIPEEYHLIF